MYNYLLNWHLSPMKPGGHWHWPVIAWQLASCSQSHTRSHPAPHFPERRHYVGCFSEVWCDYIGNHKSIHVFVIICEIQVPRSNSEEYVHWDTKVTFRTGFLALWSPPSWGTLAHPTLRITFTSVPTLALEDTPCTVTIRPAFWNIKPMSLYFHIMLVFRNIRY